MEFSLDDILFSGGHDSGLAVPFDDVDDFAPPSRSSSTSLINGSTNRHSLSPGFQQSAVESSIPGLSIDWKASFEQAKAATTTPTDELQDGFSFLDELDRQWQMPAPQQPGNSIAEAPITTIDEFFIKNGASRPPAPCVNCRRRRLQCLILHTTTVNPNPTKSCSSCVALFRECSFTGRQKREPSAFETSEPVIGRLHGVSEHDTLFEVPEEAPGGHMDAQPSQSLSQNMSISALSGKRTNTRSVRKTRVLRNWFICHLDHPYPSEEEKVDLASQSGLNRSQVVNWFANTRRRHRLSGHLHSQNYSNQNKHNTQKQFKSGSPAPQYMGRNSMSPLERWRNSPPEDEAASASAIQSALFEQSSSHGSADNFDLSLFDGPTSSASGDSFWYANSAFQEPSPNSASSCYSFRSAMEHNFLSRSGNSSAGEGPSHSRPTSSRSKNSKFQAFQCTFCRQNFKKKYDWVRHERSIHLPGLDSWVCSIPVPADQSYLVWRVGESSPRCIFCGKDSPSNEHIQSHEFDTCAERPVSERKFTRKDHLWQHLHKFHGCRKWDGWKPDLSLLQHRQDTVRSKCGFCQKYTESWEERTDHLAQHFRSGMTMEHWVGGSGIHDPGEMDVDESMKTVGFM